MSAARSRALAAVALADHMQELSERELGHVIQDWWRGEVAPALLAGRAVISREDFYALFEMLHAIRDNLNIDLRENRRGILQDPADLRPGELLPRDVSGAGG